jgi:HSP20 family protein
MTFYVSTSPYHLARRWAVRTAEQETPRALPVDLREQEDAYLLTAYVPGLRAEDLNIQIVEDTLTIEGEYSQHEGEALMSELPAGSFRRALRLPALLDAEKAEAQIENGVLNLRIPKAESARPRVIKVASK